LGISIDELQHRYESSFPVRAERFKIRQRALHVYTEALRVLEFIELLESKTSEEEIGRKLGALMNATQTSCRELYDCSCPELDEMCRIALNAGAYGSRLTGAGWGGCSVHLVPSDKVESVRSAWDAEYYEKMEGGRGISEEMRKKAVVVSRPGSGSAVVRVKGLGLGLWDGGASAI
jgi:galactokinase